jgi:outer membrane protein assembly factor BamB
MPWPTFMHDYSHTGLSQFTGMQSNFTLWKLNVKNGTSALVLGQNDMIYFGSWGSLVALDIDHTEKFRIKVGGIVDPPSIGYDGTIYFENGGNTIFAANPGGTIKWKYQSNETVTIPAIDIYGRIYFGSSNFLESISPDGKFLWKYKTNGLVSIPSMGPDGAIYFGNTDHNFYAIDSSGNLKWKFNAKGITTLASIIPQGTVYFCDSDNYLYAINRDGKLKWTYQSTNSGTPPAIGSDKTLFLTDGTGLVALSQDGIKKWDFHPANIILQSVSVDRDGIIYAGSYENYLYALDSFGNVKWDYKSYGSVSQPVIGSDGTIYFNSGEGVIYALGQPSIPEFPMPILLIIILFISILVIPRVFPRHL